MRIRKTKKAVVHVGKPLHARGWQLPLKWRIIARRGTDSTFQKMARVFQGDVSEARAIAKGLLVRWDSVEIRSEEILHPLRVA